MTPLRDLAGDWLATHRPAIVVKVTDTKGSVPREPGTRMLVAGDAVDGTIGGGHLELKAIEHARQMLAGDAGDKPQPTTLHFPLGPALGQCCGGAVTLGFVRLNDEELARWPDEPPLCRLQLYGAGHVGRAIVRLLATLHVEVDWIDEREEEFPTHLYGHPAPWPAHIRKLCVDAVESEVRTAPPGAFYLVMTHRHDLDLAITEAVLKRGDFSWLGLIGSKTKRARFVHHFERRGIAPALIERMTCPIGILGIDGKQPEVIAVAVVAQMLQVAGSRTGPADNAPALRPPQR